MRGFSSLSMKYVLVSVPSSFVTGFNSSFACIFGHLLRKTIKEEKLQRKKTNLLISFFFFFFVK